MTYEVNKNASDIDKQGLIVLVEHHRYTKVFSVVDASDLIAKSAADYDAADYTGDYERPHDIASAKAWLASDAVRCHLITYDTWLNHYSQNYMVNLSDANKEALRLNWFTN